MRVCVVVILLVEDSFCDLPEITEDALTRELAETDGAAAVDVPFHKQYRCILGFVAQTCYVYVHLPPLPPSPPHSVFLWHPPPPLFFPSPPV